MKPNWLYTQSGVIPYRETHGMTQLILITSRKGKKWIFPKGIVEKGLTPEKSAQKEALEEAGVLGTIEAEVGEYYYKKWKGVCMVTVYALRVNTILEQWEEQNKRQRQIVTLDEAVHLIKNKKLIEMVQRHFLIARKTL